MFILDIHTPAEAEDFIQSLRWIEAIKDAPIKYEIIDRDWSEVQKIIDDTAS